MAVMVTTITTTLTPWLVVGGSDVYYVNSVRDTLVELVGEGTDSVFSTETYSLDLVQYANVENLTLTGTADTDATGNSLWQYSYW